MGVSRRDREEYKEGRRDRKRNIFEQAHDITVNHPDSEPYYKGRRGEQLDKDKKQRHK